MDATRWELRFLLGTTDAILYVLLVVPGVNSKKSRIPSRFWKNGPETTDLPLSCNQFANHHETTKEIPHKDVSLNTLIRFVKNIHSAQ